MTGRLTAPLKALDPFILIMIGLVILASILPVRDEAATFAAMVTDLAIALLFFLHGAKLSRESILSGMSNWRLHAGVLAATFILFPAIGMSARYGLSAVVSPVILTGCLFLCLLPSTVQSSIAFTAIARGNVAAAVCSASLSNFIGIFLTPALVALTMGQAANVSWTAVEKIALQLLLPFAAGHVLRPLMLSPLTRHKTLLMRVDRLSILLVVYTAFSASVVEGLWSRLSFLDLCLILALCAGLLALVMWILSVAGHRLGFSREDRITLLFCGSKKSLASGVPIASTLFPPALLGPILLPLMVFHQIQLIVCAFVAARYGEQAEKTESET